MPLHRGVMLPLKPIGVKGPLTRRQNIEPLLDSTLAVFYRPLLALPADANPQLATATVWQRRDLAPPGPR